MKNNNKSCSKTFFFIILDRLFKCQKNILKHCPLVHIYVHACIWNLLIIFSSGTIEILFAWKTNLQDKNDVDQMNCMCYLPTCYQINLSLINLDYVIYKALCFDVAQGRMNGAPNESRTHSCRSASLAC